MLEHRSEDRVQAKDQIQRKSIKMFKGKAAQCKLLWNWNDKGLGGVRIFLAEKWVDKFIDITKIRDRMLLRSWFKVLWVQSSQFMSYSLVQMRLKKTIHLIVLTYDGLMVLPSVTTTVMNTLFRKRGNHLASYESDPSKKKLKTKKSYHVKSITTQINGF